MGQKQSYILGLLGLVPFIIIFLMYFISPPNDEIYNLMIFIYIAYAAIISSFLGGIQWGLITAFADKIYYVFTPLLITVIPALISWAALLSLENLKLSLLLLLIGYVISLLHDYYLYQQLKITPLWFMTMKLILSLTVSILTIILIIFI